jgi:hypothetical protein
MENHETNSADLDVFRNYGGSQFVFTINQAKPEAIQFNGEGHPEPD